jgi:hypothetical protein
MQIDDLKMLDDTAIAQIDPGTSDLMPARGANCGRKTGKKGVKE